MNDWLYKYQATVVRVIDGDTLELRIDLGFHLNYTRIVRLYGYNAPELNTDEGKAAKFKLRKLFEANTSVLFISHSDKPDKYGRLLGTIYHEGEPIV